MRGHSTLVALAFVLSASAATISTRSARIQECLATNVVGTRTVLVGEDIVEIKTVKCPELVPLHGSGGNISLPTDDALTRRSASECKNPSECQCGQSCSGQCANNGLAAPLTTDCQKLQQLFTSGSPSTFLIEPGSFVQAPLGTCQFFVFNLRQTEVEFCDDDWVNTGLQLAQACIPAGFDAGICEPANSAIAVEFARFD